MLHPTRVARALSGNLKRQLRRPLRIPSRPKAPVLANDVKVIAKWPGFPCRQLLDRLPAKGNLNGILGCEVSADDLEGPLLPLDFQRHPDRLHEWEYPRSCCGYRLRLEQAGFKVVWIRPLRLAEPAYVEAIRPRLRPAIREFPAEELSVLEFAVLAERS